MNIRKIKNINSWDFHLDLTEKEQYLHELEHGNIMYLPQLPFNMTTEYRALLSPNILSPKKKNISYDIRSNSLKGYNPQVSDSSIIQHMMNRFAKQAQNLIHSMFPSYKPYLKIGRTSFRPAEIKGRKTHYRKDDARLHVDSFVSTPVNGNRILRIFSNINQKNLNREWNLGEPFQAVTNRFLPKIRTPFLGESALLNLLGVTKTKRSLYDHYMLHIHDCMKGDQEYQHQVNKKTFLFPANTTWIVFTDQVSHAALSGQHLLEQTFYLPVTAQKFPEQSPLRQLESQLQRKLM